MNNGTASSSSASGSTSNMNSLHDVIVNYVHNSAYSSTARILSQTQAKRSQNGGDDDDEANISRKEDEDEDDDDDADGMEIDDEESVLKEISESSNRNRKAAKSPMKDYSLLNEEDLEGIEQRRVILNHILNGSISKSVELLNTNFPSVLSESIPTNLTSSNGNGHSSSSSNFNSHSNPYSSYSSGYMKYKANHSIPVLNKSTEPSHIRLNLQIQQFIESFRQLSPSIPSSPASSIGDLTNSQTYQGISASSSSSSPAGLLTASNTNTNSNSHSNSTSTQTLTHALSAAQGLHSEAKKLSAEIRAIYLQEIKDVGALFAYTDPENSILKGFLDQSRRIRLADQVNAAILKSQNKPTQSALETFARRTTVLYKVMSDNGISPKPTWTDSTGDGKGKHHLAEYWKQSNGKSFNLHDFVNSTW
ncbi:uncharacterized protein IL334_003385 [Kwoniella shivajii]|uniref:CRA domain-containing protein n=1 Tax=Kwoniella shivajii TaxID=564305 RepID=A0ABZ1CXF4_9TREE|nr:hypothetical protein IL334_003385 [Kwoniella shivajii]